MPQTNFDNLIWNKPGLPDKVKSDEDVVLVVREDAVIIASKAIGLFIIFIFLLLLRTILIGMFDKSSLAFYDLFFFGVNSVMLLMFTVIFHNYYLSLQIVTTERVIDVDQRGLFNREVNTLSISNIEDVNYKKSGFWGTLLNYGNVVVQTAGSAGDAAEGKVSGFVFDNVPNPASISTQIMALYQRDQQRTMSTSAILNAQALSQALNNMPENHNINR